MRPRNVPAHACMSEAQITLEVLSAYRKGGGQKVKASLSTAGPCSCANSGLDSLQQVGVEAS